MRNIFRSAFGRITVPISRPSMITSYFSAIPRCISTRNSLTAGMAETFEASIETSGSLMSRETSFPSRYMCCSPASLYLSSISSVGSSSITAAVSSRLTPRILVARPMVLYIAPVSTYIKPNFSAAFRDIVLFPAPDGPSMAIEIISYPSLNRICGNICR